MALPTLTRTLDDDFVNTWYEIRAEVADNILEATILWLALKEHGCLVPQVGGEYITRTIGYGEKSTQRFAEGTVLDQEIKKLDTMARWDWRFFLVDVNRSVIDDRKNAGKFKIKDYLARRLEAARNALVTDMETYMMQWGAYYAAPEQPNGIYDICGPDSAVSTGGNGSNSGTYATGTSNGNINRTNTWWRNWVQYNDATETPASKIAGATTEPYSLNLLPDMRHFFNSINANQEPPNFIMYNQSIYEAYEDEVSDKQQIVRSAFNRKAADLGFETLTFKGATMTYSGKISSSNLHGFFLNLNHIELPYDPELWFDMTNWKETPNQLERVAYIACMTPGMITDQPRRHGFQNWAS